jgi:hypothetical protein
MKKNEEGRACSMHRTGEKSVQGFGWKALRKETTQKMEAEMGGWD